MERKDYYSVLSVAQDASAEEIRAAYRRLAFEYHPDRNADDVAAADKMKALNEAYAVLSDDNKRRQYQALYRQYGEGAREQFRQTYSEQDIFKGSDIQQMFEEMARAFGLRGFDDIFKEFDGQGHERFEFRSHGLSGSGIFSGPLFGRAGLGQGPRGMAGSLMHKLLTRLIGAHLPKRGNHMHDVIVLTPGLAEKGGPYAYHHRASDKKLVVHIPVGVRHGQLIRLTGMGQEGRRGGQAGDMLLKVKIRETIFKRVKNMFGLDQFIA